MDSFLFVPQWRGHLLWSAGGIAPPVGLSPAATGGVETLIEQGGKYYRVHTFGAGMGEFVANHNIPHAERLLVAGGGGGGGGKWDSGGGGDGGQPIFVAGPIGAGNYPINVGVGGAGGTYITPPTNGAASSAFGDTAIGGGAGGHNRGVGQVGWGSGGTAAVLFAIPPTGPSGFRGGAGDNGTLGSSNAGGGAGAGGNGQDANPTTGVNASDPGMGGPGIVYDISGAAIEYSKGAGGKSRYDVDKNGASGDTPGSGGEAGYRFQDDPATRTGGKGADGICIVRYEISQAEFLGIDIPVPAATGGVETLIQDGADYYRVHTFNSDGVFTANAPVSAEILVVGGGGSGGNSRWHTGGGGDAGQVISDTLAITAGSYPIVIGRGGIGGSGSAAPVRGSNSSAFGQTAIAGGVGGHDQQLGQIGWGSGGNASRATTPPPVGPSGFRGGAGADGVWNGPDPENAGGGAGSGGDGQSANSTANPSHHRSPGAGGDGINSSIAGTAVEYGRGGNGGNRDEANAPDGQTPGSGGFGGYRYDVDLSRTAGDGADGICIIRYKITQAEYEAV